MRQARIPHLTMRQARTIRPTMRPAVIRQGLILQRFPRRLLLLKKTAVGGKDETDGTGAVFCGTCLFDTGSKCFGGENGRNNYLTDRGKIFVTGIGRLNSPYSASSPGDRLMARRAAIVDGYSNLTEIIYADFADAAVNACGFSIADDGFIRGVECVRTTYFRDGTVQVLLSAPLNCKKRVCKGKGINVYNDKPVFREKRSIPITEEKWELLIERKNHFERGK